MDEASPVLPPTQQEPSDLTPVAKKFYQQRLFMYGCSIFVIMLLVGVGIVIMGKTSQNQISPPISTIPSHSPTIDPPENEDMSDLGVLPVANGDMIKACKRNLNTFPDLSAYIKSGIYLDFAGNNMTALPQDLTSLKKIQEIILLRNNFSSSEQARIKTAIPNAKIAFIPQNDFIPDIAPNWKTYTNNLFSLSLKYHPDLLLEEKDNIITISNGLNSFASAHASCIIDDDYISMIIKVEDNPKGLSPTQFIEEEYNFGEPIPPEGKPQSMIGPLKKYKNGEIEGILTQTGESENYQVYATQNGKMYVFMLLPGGETGSTIGDMPEKLFFDTLSTVRFNN